jgi:hypothetical protein
MKMFETIFKKVAIVGLGIGMVFIVACSSPAAEVQETAVSNPASDADVKGCVLFVFIKDVNSVQSR